jgi:hypothetical protein
MISKVSKVIQGILNREKGIEQVAEMYPEWQQVADAHGMTLLEAINNHLVGPAL